MIQTIPGSYGAYNLRNFKVVIYSVHREAVYQAALAFVNTVEPTPQSGLARAYYDKSGKLLETLEQVCEAAANGDFEASNPAA